MDDTSMTFTTLALIVLLIIMIVMFMCHFLGPQSATSNWMRSSKEEEKVGLSKNKLFHANGYMFHSSGSEFLLSTSGSFKRFDTIDKDDHKESAALQQTLMNSTNNNIAKGSQQSTTPLWNFPQTDCSIPPQPLRPAPGIGSNGKSVTFSFNKLETCETEPSSELSQVLIEHAQNIDHPSLRSDIAVESCMGAEIKTTTVPQPIEAPPPPRLSTSTSVILSNTAIPRPLTKRQISLNNGLPAGNGKTNTTAKIMARITSSSEERHNTKLLKRRNSSTNPFLCESVEILPEPNTALSANSTYNNGLSVREEAQFDTHTNDIATTIVSNNPFHIDIMPSSNTVKVRAEANGEQQSLSKNSAAQEIASKREVLHSKHFRNRSFSATEVTEPNLNTASEPGLFLRSGPRNPFTGLTQKVKGPHMLQKTISEDFLLRKFGLNSSSTSGCQGSTWSFGRSFKRQDSILSLGRPNSSLGSLDSASSMGSIDGSNLERAISCDSVNSDSSVFVTELDQPYTQITGYLCVGLKYDKNSITNDGMGLTVTVLEARNLICPFTVEFLDTFVRIYLVPDQAGAMQTKVITNSQTPRYNESFNLWMSKQNGRHSLWFHLYHNGVAHTLIGEAEMEIGEMPRPVTTWIPLSDSRKCNAQWGELMFSLSYLPTAERLTLVVVKARNLKLDVELNPRNASQEINNIFVKAYLMNNDKKVLKKRTSLKRKDRCPIFNESMIFSVPPHTLSIAQLRLTVFGVLDDGATIEPLGHIIAGSCATGKGLRHWHQMLSSLRKPVAMWHVLRRATNQPIFTGGAEAVVAAMQSTARRNAKRNSII